MSNITKTIKPMIFETYMAVIRNSVGSEMYRNLFVRINGRKKDAAEDGKLSCAFFVSSILASFNLIKKMHGIVDSTVADLKESGWKIIRRPRAGCILVWESIDVGNSRHKHIGFYIGDKRAVSNNDRTRKPGKHNWNFDGKRKIVEMFWNPILGK